MKTILFVENDAVVLTMYRNRLQAEGYRIEVAEDGLEALRLLTDATPNLIVLDLMLPKLSGADVLKFVRAEPRLKHVPVILFSNAYMTELGEDAVLGSANKRLLKAYTTPASLLEHIREQLAAAEAPTPTFGVGGGPASAALNGQSSASSIDAGCSAPPTPTTPPLSREEFLKQVRSQTASIREHCRSYVKAPASKEGQQSLVRFHEMVHQLSTSVARTDCARVSMLMKAFDAMLSEVASKPAWASPSVLQTIAQATDCLDLLTKSEAACSGGTLTGKVLVIDDDLVCNRVMVTSLKRVNLEPVSLQDPKEGLQLLRKHHFEVVLLDVNMPNMTGFEVCEQLRTLSHCKTTPVIFVTAYSNFQNRTQGVLSGGDDFITKPVSPLELALKVTIHMLKAHVQRAGAPLPEIAPQIPESSPPPLPSRGSSEPLQINGAPVVPTAPDVPAPALDPSRINPTAPVEPVPALDAAAPAHAQPAATETANTSAVLPSELNPGDVPPEVLELAALIQANEHGNASAGKTPPTMLVVSTTESATSPQEASTSELPPIQQPPVEAPMTEPALEPVAALSAGVADSAPAPGLFPTSDWTPTEPVKAEVESSQPQASAAGSPLQTESLAAFPALFPMVESQMADAPRADIASTSPVAIPTPANGSPAALFEPFDSIAVPPPAAAEPHTASTESSNTFVPADLFSSQPQSPLNEPITRNPAGEIPVVDMPSPASTEIIPPAETATAAAAETVISAAESQNSVAENSSLPGELLPLASEPVNASMNSETPLTESSRSVEGNMPSDQPAPPEVESLIPATESAIVESASFQSASEMVVESPSEPIPAAPEAAAILESAPAHENARGPELAALAAQSAPEIFPATESAMTTDSAPAVENIAAPVCEPEPLSTPPSLEIAAAQSASTSHPTAPSGNGVAEAAFEELVHRVTWIIYGEFNATETDERMVRLALERYRVDELLRNLPRA